MHLMGDSIADRVATPVKSIYERKMVIGLIVFFVLSACLWIGLLWSGNGQSPSESVLGEIRSQKFVVVDENGNERAELGVLPNGQAQLTIWNEGKSFSALVGMDHAGMPHIGLGIANGPPFVDMGVLDKRTPVFILRGADGKRRLGAVVTEKGLVSIGLYDTSKRDRCNLRVGLDGIPQLTLKDKKGNVRSRLMVDSDGSCALDLLDQNGRVRVVLQVDPKGEPDLAILGSDEKPIWSARRP